MTVHQLSVFAENKSGIIQRVLDLLKEGNIQIIASTIADTTDYGIYRIICSEPTRAYETLRAAGIQVSLTDVFAITLENEVGKAADTIKLFSDAGIDTHNFFLPQTFFKCYYYIYKTAKNIFFC